jgi:hypothetical protein
VAISCQQRLGWNSPFNPRFGYSPYYHAMLHYGQPFMQSEVLNDFVPQIFGKSNSFF